MALRSDYNVNERVPSLLQLIRMAFLQTSHLILLLTPTQRIFVLLQIFRQLGNP